MTSTVKLSGEERRVAIIQAVRHLFANKGFKGTTTRELAEAAGVSEALLYRHFPAKEDLFAAIQHSFCDDQARARFERLRALEPSTQTLVLLVHFLAYQIVGTEENAMEQAIRRRMMLRSLAEDGEFARIIMQPFSSIVLPKIEECLTAAIETGDAITGPLQPSLGGWFAYNLATMASFEIVQNPAVVDFGVPHAGLIGQLVWFALRGLGLHEDAIRRHYKPEALSVLGW
jgi:AcrR family transcriptional regulator